MPLPGARTTATPIKPVQYSMRSLLVLTGVIAALAAIAVPTIDDVAQKHKTIY